MTGTLGGGCMEADVRRRAHELLTDARSELFTFELDHDFGYDDGMICGGQMDVAVSVLDSANHIPPIRRAVADLQRGEASSLALRIATDKGLVEYRLRLESAPRLLIAGGGHIARRVADLAVPLGFCVTVLDDRSAYANAERFPPPITPLVGDIAKTLSDSPIDANTYIVIVTRGHQHDERALEAVLDSPARYVGMIGSHRKIDVIFEDLRHAGASDEQLARVHAPIGLSIGSVTTQEIAVSIAAELVSVRRAQRHRAVEGPFPVPDTSA